MLSREVCKKCLAEKGYDYLIGIHADQRHWICMNILREYLVPGKYVNFDDAPPSECPYKFEHAVAEGTSVNIDKIGADDE
jgi:hypothetical protein